MWEYAEAGRLLTMECVTATMCIYCQTPLARLPAKKFEAGERTLLVQFSLCLVCGWWTVYRVHQGDRPRSREAESYSGAIGCLKELDLKEVSIPLGAVRKYIAAKTAERFAAMGRPVELINAEQFFQKLGIAQLKRIDITDERINSYILSPGAHLGSGFAKQFVEGENILDRPVVARTFTRDELLEVAEDGSTSAVAPDEDEA